MQNTTPQMEVLVRIAHIVGKTLPHDDLIPPCGTNDTKQYFSRGVHAKFRKLNTQWGMKFYYDVQERNENYSVMTKAAAHGLATKCGGKFKFKVGDHTFYGFIVECCLPVGEIPNIDYWKRCIQFPTFAEDIRILGGKLQAIGIPPEDLHFGNVAYKGGKLIAIDLSCSTPHKYEFHRH